MPISMPALNHIVFFTLCSYLFSPHRHSLFGTTGIARGFLFYKKAPRAALKAAQGDFAPV